jgi:hypothetical protein
MMRDVGQIVSWIAIACYVGLILATAIGTTRLAQWCAYAYFGIILVVSSITAIVVFFVMMGMFVYGWYSLIARLL